MNSFVLKMFVVVHDCPFGLLFYSPIAYFTMFLLAWGSNRHVGC